MVKHFLLGCSSKYVK